MIKFFICEGKDELFTDKPDESECKILVHSDMLYILPKCPRRTGHDETEYHYDMKVVTDLKPITISHGCYTFKGYNHEMASISTEIINDLNSESFDHSKICHLLRILICRLKQLDKIKQEYVNVVNSL